MAFATLLLKALVLVVVASFTQAVILEPPAADSPPDTNFVIGMLSIVDTHQDGTPLWVLRTVYGDLIPLAKNSSKPPAGTLPGALVHMNCNYDNDGMCDPQFYEEICLPCSMCSPMAASLAASMDNNNGTIIACSYGPPPTIFQRLLVIILDYSSSGYAPSLNESTVRSLFLGPNGDGTGGIAQKYAQCSYGKFNLSPQGFRVLTVRQNYSNAVAAKCNWWEISNNADAAARNILGLLTLSTFTHFVYILPPGLQKACGWWGLGMLPGNQVWLQTTSYGVYRWESVMQEALHNYGLWHSKDGTGSLDNSTLMGRGNACPNAAEISRMGWAIPAPGGGAISSASFAPGSALAFVLPATYLTGDGNYLRVVPDWLPTYTDSTLAKNLYIAVRVANGSSANLVASFAPKVNVHEVNATMDNEYPAAYSYGDRKITIISTIPSLGRANLTAYNLVVYGGPWTSTDVMRVYLCRYTTSPSECPGLGALDVPPPPPPSPKPPSPSPTSYPKPPNPPAPRPRPPNRPPPPRPKPPNPLPPRPRPSSRPPPPSPTQPGAAPAAATAVADTV
ncbi:metalloproteinase, extracellular matrix glycoprotein VMP9 [Volvox carteri f. nagariensis]|uniref:Metalloproteinase, extracellular matrix glycoprotein VMP9 n=1 Tax=Volvox carteri f. nagariensis TaxID=3068 RepID=D8TPK8_VOLCA|nr:metalloproteinase, extracellular matrix glycoprotein VMP9 [Volvox carteri f. nagariensis]EFJ50634.1 metalloproteinase, extracellular matrix glycoprotein VMP9 [Volvox carteri f. nagariensis]|eukprot:XP_002948227.1 metalloproteinase, extracellular matrix glycoprotein VMP9 [Volvox carteri f. nagariensis]